MWKRRLLSVLLCLAMLLTLMPSAVLASTSSTLTINGNRYTDLSTARRGNGWRWDPETQVLTLDGYTGGAIIADGDLTIDLPADTSAIISANDRSSAIRSSGRLTIGGSGTLMVQNYTTGSDLYGILAAGVCIGENVSLTVDTKATGISTSIGIYCSREDLVIRDSANVTVLTVAEAIKYDDSPYAYGLFSYAAVRISTAGNVDVITTSTGEHAFAVGIRAEDGVELEGDSAVTVTATSEGDSSNAYGISAWGPVNIDGNASISTTAVAGETGYGIVFETMDTDANSDELAVVVGEDVHHVDISGTTQAVLLDSDITKVDPDRVVETGKSSGNTVTIDQKVASYAVEFDANGGIVDLEAAMTDKNGCLIALPKPQHPDGYLFDGWYNDPIGGRQVTLSTVFSKDTTIYAHWTVPASDGKQTVAIGAFLHDGQNYFVTDARYTYTLAEDSNEITVFAYVPTRVTGLCMHTVVGAARESLTMLSYPVDGYLPLTIKVDPNETAPIRIWFTLTENADYTDAVSNVITLSVQKMTKPMATLQFDTRGGSTAASITESAGTEVDLNSIVPVREDHTFAGWYTDLSFTTRVTSLVLEEDMILYAKWEEIVKVFYTLHFDTMGGETISDLVQEAETKIQLGRIVPVRTGYSFDGWYADPALSAAVSSVVLTEDTTIYAKWEIIPADLPNFILRFHTNGGSAIGNVVKAAETRVELSGFLPEREGYTFAGWYADPALSEPIDEVTLSADTTVYAKWTAVVVPKYTLYFNTLGGSAIKDIKETAGTSIELADFIPTRTSYTFVRWYADAALTLPVSYVRLTQDTTVYAKWEQNEKHENNENNENDENNTFELPFDDVKKSDWFYSGVAYCYIHGFMEGTSKTTFAPNGIVSRAELVTILYRMEGSPKVKFRGVFADVPAGKWFSNAVEWAAANGVVKGIGDGTNYAPDMKITREQIATILYRYNGAPKVSTDLSGYPDQAKISNFAKTAMIWAVDKGIITGKKINGVAYLAPLDNATRAEIATMIMRYHQMK